MKPITIKEIASAVGGTIFGVCDDIFIKNITTDSRNVKEGDLFIPIEGENFDGHDFINHCFESGAVCSFSMKNICIPKEKCIILVDNTLKALKTLAEYYLSLFDICVVGITGSVGKTTTKDMIAAVLEQKYNVLKTQGNFNNEIGLPLTVFNIEPYHTAAVLEMGMNQFGEIRNLSRIAKPNIAVITNVGVSHIENLGSREGILKAKSEIFEFVKHNGKAVLNADNDMLITLKDKLDIDILWFGIKNKLGIFADNIVSDGLDGVSCNIHTQNGSFCVNIPIPGEHMVYNALTSASVGVLMGLSNDEIKKGIEGFKASKMRMYSFKNKNGVNIINDVYNANPVSVKASIDVLAGVEGRKVCILGDMFELGEYAQQMHYDIGAYAAEKNIDVIICIGELSRFMYDGACKNTKIKAFYFKTQEEFLLNNLYKYILNGDTVLVKASRGMHFEKTIEKLEVN